MSPRMTLKIKEKIVTVPQNSCKDKGRDSGMNQSQNNFKGFWNSCLYILKVKQRPSECSLKNTVKKYCKEKKRNSMLTVPQGKICQKLNSPYFVADQEACLCSLLLCLFSTVVCFFWHLPATVLTGSERSHDTTEVKGINFFFTAVVFCFCIFVVASVNRLTPPYLPAQKQKFWGWTQNWKHWNIWKCCFCLKRTDWGKFLVQSPDWNTDWFSSDKSLFRFSAPSLREEENDFKSNSQVSSASPVESVNRDEPQRHDERLQMDLFMPCGCVFPGPGLQVDGGCL